MVGSSLVPNRWLTQSITEVVRSGTPVTKSAIWLKSNCPKTTARARATSSALPPTMPVATPLDRPRWTDHWMPGSMAMESSQASRTRNKKWLSMENSHRNSSSPATSPMRTSPDRHTDVRSKRTLTTRPPCLFGPATVGGISELAVRSASGVNSSSLVPGVRGGALLGCGQSSRSHHRELVKLQRSPAAHQIGETAGHSGEGLPCRESAVTSTRRADEGRDQRGRGPAPGRPVVGWPARRPRPRAARARR